MSTSYDGERDPYTISRTVLSTVDTVRVTQVNAPHKAPFHYLRVNNLPQGGFDTERPNVNEVRWVVASPTWDIDWVIKSARGGGASESFLLIPITRAAKDRIQEVVPGAEYLDVNIDTEEVTR